MGGHIPRHDRLAYGSRDGLGNDAEMYLCLGFVAFTARQMFERVDPRAIVAGGESVGVAVGWDEGSPLYIGRVTADGFHVRDAGDAKEGLARQRAKFEALVRSFREGPSP